MKYRHKQIKSRMSNGDGDDNKQLKGDIFIWKFLEHDATRNQDLIWRTSTDRSNGNRQQQQLQQHFWNMFIFTRRYFRNTNTQRMDKDVVNCKSNDGGVGRVYEEVSRQLRVVFIPSLDRSSYLCKPLARLIVLLTQ